MEAKPKGDMDGAQAAAQPEVEQLRVDLERRHQELDDLLIRGETLHPSAYAALQGQLEEEIETLQAKLNRLTAGAK